MSTDPQIQDDIRFLRAAVVRREQPPRTPASISYTWAAYVLIGYTMIDFAPDVCGWFFMIGGIVGGILSAWIGRNAERRRGEVDREYGRRAMLHWMGGILLASAGTFALAVVIPALRGPSGSQVLVVMIGVVYFLGGVHFERHFLWLGPVLIAGGVLVGLVPNYGWTTLGLVIATGLVAPTFFPPRGSNDGLTGLSGAAQVAV